MIDWSKIHYIKKPESIYLTIFPGGVKVKAIPPIFKDSPLVGNQDGTVRAMMVTVDEPGSCVGYACDEPDEDGFVIMRPPQ